MVIINGPLEGSDTLLDFGPCVDFEKRSALFIVWCDCLSLLDRFVEFGLKDKEAGGGWEVLLLGGRQAFRSVDGSFTLRIADLAVCFILLFPVPVG